ncbi:hypothetical protein MES5069_310123 [Mesorhizobium escarrei]|uniref:Uncharacterized protein n=1 Tax=Mesorhizobium escarrei TaxID=666018 RepID=A0ABM9E1B3_9HYPH|nr:hypothetical protein MES5069_310123 [Mesorhizobium escarrei]
MPLHQPKIATAACEAAGDGCTNPFPFYCHGLAPSNSFF